MKIIFSKKKTNFFLSSFLKLIPICVLSFSLCLPALIFICNYFFLNSPIYYLALSLDGFKRNFFWQIITYSFINSKSSHFGVFFIFKSIFVFLFFKSLIEKARAYLGCKKTILFIILQILFTAAILLGIMTTKNFIDSPPFLGTDPLLFSLLFLFVFLNPNFQIKIFRMLPPIYFKWLFLIGSGFLLLLQIFHNRFLNFFSYISSLIFVLVFCFINKIHNPYWKELAPQNKAKKTKVRVME